MPAQDAHRSRVTTHDLGEFGRDVGHARQMGAFGGGRRVLIANRLSAIGSRKPGAPNGANVAKCRIFWGCDECDNEWDPHG
jgi:hypothetical protein